LKYNERFVDEAFGFRVLAASEIGVVNGEDLFADIDYIARIA
jgi:hypothetical protein